MTKSTIMYFGIIGIKIFLFVWEWIFSCLFRSDMKDMAPALCNQVG